ncbi:hypothetical protein AB0G60_12920 [Streptomyces angustmyceticus]|nr:hypothetical protein [Streptomyces angustmyceticus]UAL67421.1 hypothetical protein K7396_13435 [Streptomyces angustmyceticus]
MLAIATAEMNEAAVEIRASVDDAEFGGHSLDEVTRNISQPPAEKNPDDCSDIDFRISDETSEIKISISPTHASVYISSPVPSWAHGHATQILTVLEAAGGCRFTTVTSDETWKQVTRSAKISLLVLGTWLSSAIITDRRFQFSDLQTTVIAAVVVYITTYVKTILSEIRSPKLSLTSDIKTHSWWEDSSLANKIAMGSLIAALLSAVAAFAALKG